MVGYAESVEILPDLHFQRERRRLVFAERFCYLGIYLAFSSDESINLSINDNFVNWPFGKVDTDQPAYADPMSAT
jgi:hypothetical protein